MFWFITITISAYFLLALSNEINKFLIDKVLPSSRAYAFLISSMSALVLIAAPWFLIWPGWFWLGVNLVAGALFPIALILTFEALKRGDASKMTVLIGGFVATFSILFSIIFFKESFTGLQWWGLLLLLIGMFLIAAVPSLKKTKFIFDKVGISLAVLSALAFALLFIGTKYAYNYQNFASSFIWIRLGGLLMALLFLVRTKDRREIFSSFKNKPPLSGASPAKLSGASPVKRSNIFLLVIGQVFGSAGFILQNYAISMGSVAIVNALEGVQYGFLLVMGFFMTIFKPKMIKENISLHAIILKVLAIIAISVGIYFLTI
jgi:drug/metabolite transporter (DMT)-like permease